jgi:hypothetical protein
VIGFDLTGIPCAEFRLGTRLAVATPLPQVPLTPALEQKLCTSVASLRLVEGVGYATAAQ